MRVETVINDPTDLGCLRRLHHLPELQAWARAVDRRLVDTERRPGLRPLLAHPTNFERIAHPTTTVDGRRAPALRFGDPRVQALAGALCTTALAVSGITNKSLRAVMTGLLAQPYSMNRASYDLIRLRRNGLITRLPGRNTYRLTPDGLAFAIFYTKVHNPGASTAAGHRRTHNPTRPARGHPHHRWPYRRTARPRTATVGGRLKL